MRNAYIGINDKIGKGKCNHIECRNSVESSDDFLARCEKSIIIGSFRGGNVFKNGDVELEDNNGKYFNIYNPKLKSGGYSFDIYDSKTRSLTGEECQFNGDSMYEINCLIKSFK